MRSFYSLAAFLFLSFSLLQAQDFCRPDTSHSVKISYREIKDYLSHSQARLEADTIYLPLQIHVVKSTSGEQSDVAAILQSIPVLNERFRSTKIQFVLCGEINTITSDLFSVLDNAQESTDLINMYNNPHTIDVIYVNDVTYWYVCGFASIGWSGDGYVIMKKGCEMGGTLEHEMGHYFNLMHTHETAFGAELVNGSNCTYAGDQLCDTPADPNLQWEVLPFNCAYTNTTLKDANGEIYKPLVNNIMSYAAHNCKNSFTPEQTARMRYYYDTFLAGMYSCSSQPDFTARLSVDQGTFKKGQANVVQLIIKNNSGTAYSGSLGFEVYLEDGSGNKTMLAAGSGNRNYPGFFTDTTELVLTVPAHLSDGTYSLISVIDPDGAVEEGNEINNRYSQLVGLFPNGGLLPDLIVSYTGETSHHSGELLTVQAEYKNVGNTSASAFFTADVYISEDAKLDFNDLKLGYNTVDVALMPGESLTKTFYTGVPADRSGYIIACADAFDFVEELDNNNNCTVQKITNVAGPITSRPDYSITSHRFISQQSNQYLQLDQLQVEFNIANSGPGFPDDSHLFTGVYLSKDQTLSADDMLMGYGTGGGRRSIQFTIPLSAVRGGYYVLAKVDFRNYITEGNENNNTYHFRIDLASMIGADLQMTQATLSDYEWTSNQVVALQGEVSNKGTYESVLGRLNVYIRKDSLRFRFPFAENTQPVFFSEWDSTLLAIGQKKTRSFSFNTAKKFNPGTYYLAACAAQPSGYREDYNDNCVVFSKPVIIRSSVITGAEEEAQAEASFNLYPNPSQGLVYLEGTNAQEVELTATGGRVFRKLLHQNSFDVSDLQPGLYTVRVKGVEQILYRKLVVE